MNREETIFEQALGIDSPADREAWLREACAGDEPLFQSLQGLLRVHDRAGKFLDPGPQGSLNQSIGAALEAVTPRSAEKPGDRIGRYKLLEKIGEGGCGVVYMAEQEEPVRRRVALKVIKLGMDTEAVIARFEAERQALALMDHPNIARIFDAGVTDSPLPASGHPLPSSDEGRGQGEGSSLVTRHSSLVTSPGRPYFIMELVRGTKITEFCDHNNLTTAQRLDLFMQVCRAVQHAHQKGIIHRDIKPSNILVTLHDGVPVPKVIDFGIAKATQGRLTDKTVFTAFQQFIGTPAYMSPEQAEMTSLDIDTRSDIYSLGVLLYELLTGKTPFDSKELMEAGLEAMRRTICEQEPQRPSAKLSTMVAGVLTTTANRRQTEPPKLLHAVRGDLDWIVMKALEKDRARRYETANGLATDLQRHLDNEPVLARPPSTLYRFQKMVRRNKLAVVAVTAVVAALLIGLAASTWLFIKERKARQVAVRAEQEQARAREEAKAEAAKSQQVARFLKEVLEGVVPSAALGRDTTLLKEILDKAAERVGRDLTNQIEVSLELRNTLAATYGELGLYKEMEDLARQSLSIARSRLPQKESPVALDALALRAQALTKLYRISDAEPVARESLALSRKLFGSSHPRVADSLASLGSVLAHANALHLRDSRSEKQLAEAKALFTEALRMRTEIFGKEHPLVALSLENLAWSLSLEGRRDKAEVALREALAMRRSLYPNGHPDLAETLVKLADSLRARSRLEEAETLSREALAMRRKLLGKEHPDVAFSLVHLADVLQALGKFGEAEKLLREGLEIRQKLWGNDHLYVATAVFSLAGVLQSQGKLAEAETRYRESLSMRTQLFGPKHENVTLALSRVADVLSRQGKLAEAEDFYRQSLALRTELFGGKHERVAVGLTDLAGVLSREGKVAEAERSYRDALAMREKLPGNEAKLVRLLQDLCGLLERQERIAEIFRLYHQHADAFHVRLQAAQPALADLLASLTYLLLNETNFAEAEPLARECLAIREKNLPDDWRTFNARSMLGGSLLGQKKYADAESLLLSGYEGLSKREQSIPLGSRVRLQEAVHRLAEICAQTGRLEQATKWKIEATELRDREAEQYRQAAESGNAQALNELAWLLATCLDEKVRDGPAAVAAAEKVVAQEHRSNPATLDTLAAAYAEAGQFEKAVTTQKEVIALQPDEKQKKDYTSRLKLYESSTPYREP